MTLCRLIVVQFCVKIHLLKHTEGWKNIEINPSGSIHFLAFLFCTVPSLVFKAKKYLVSLGIEPGTLNFCLPKFK